jgi:hypothetical protein
MYSSAAAYARPLIVARSQGAAGSFALFIALNAVLFVRPAEIVTSIEGIPIYEALIVACLVASFDKIIRRFSVQAMRAQPIIGCIVGLWAATALSHLWHFRFGDALHGATEFGKVVAYFLLLVTVVDSPARLRAFCLYVVSFIGVATALALLQYHGFIHIASLEAIRENDYDAETGTLNSFYRLCSTGIFSDPNDLSLILVVGVGLSLNFISDRQERMRRALWGVAIMIFIYALILTRSRGGLLAMTALFGTLFWMRYGPWKTVLVGLIALPAMTALAGGRQTDIDLKTGTAQARIQLWSDGLVLMKSSPLFGIGMNRYVEEVGLVAHNSFIHCFTELGLFGGAMFLGACYLSVRGAYMLAKTRAVMAPGSRNKDDSSTAPLGACLIASATGYGVGLLSLSRVYVVPTYLVLGLVTVYVETSPHHSNPSSVFRSNIFLRLFVVSTAFLAGAYVFIRFAVLR